MSIQAADDYARNALANAKEENYALVWAVLALVEVAQSIDTRLADHNTQLTELVRLAREGREAWDATQP